MVVVVTMLVVISVLIHGWSHYSYCYDRVSISISFVPCFACCLYVVLSSFNLTPLVRMSFHCSCNPGFLSMLLVCHVLYSVSISFVVVCCLLYMFSVVVAVWFVRGCGCCYC